MTKEQRERLEVLAGNWVGTTEEANRITNLVNIAYIARDNAYKEFLEYLKSLENKMST